MEIQSVAAWTFMSETAIPDDVQPLLIEVEQAVTAFKTTRDSAGFTTKRLIVRCSGHHW